MKTINKYKTNWRLATVLGGFILVSSFLTLPVQASEYISRAYHLSINLFSFEPDNPIDSYHWQGNGSCGSGGSVGLSCSDEIRYFHVTISGNQKDKRFFANVTIEPDVSDTLTELDSFEVDLSDLKARSFELAKNKDGRIYVLNLTPKVEVVDNTPKRVDIATLQLDRWDLCQSMVIIDDQYYVGRHGCAGASLAYISVQGLGKVEFALKPFRNAKPLGTLEEGVVHIEFEDGKTIDIYSVKNGAYSTELPGGPYQVWVRQQQTEESSHFPDEQEWLKQIKAKADEAGVQLPSEEKLRQKYQEMKDKKYPSLGSGVGPIEAEDRIE